MVFHHFKIIAMTKKINKEMNLNEEEELIFPDYKFKTFSIHTANYKTLFNKKFEQRVKYEAPDPKKILAFIPGTINKIMVKEGKNVKKGQELIILEAMKMMNKVQSPFNGKIKLIAVKAGEVVKKNQLLIEFE